MRRGAVGLGAVCRLWLGISHQVRRCDVEELLLAFVEGELDDEEEKIDYEE